MQRRNFLTRSALSAGVATTLAAQPSRNPHGLKYAGDWLPATRNRWTRFTVRST